MVALTEAQREHVRLLINALRSGDYLQGRCKLRTGSDHYCCLGVACEIYRNNTGDGSWLEPEGMTVRFKDNAHYLHYDVGDYFGLNYGSSVRQGDLAHMNDNGSSFHDIADLLEKWMNES